MPRTARIAPADWVFHILNRANAGNLLFEGADSYRDFLRVFEESVVTVDMRVLAYCLMPNHWHMLLWPRADSDLARFVHGIAMRHTQRWHAVHQTAGRGHLYQGRYKSFAVRHDRHLLTVCRYIERNPLRAKLVGRAEDWPWSSAAAHTRESPGATASTPRTTRVTLTKLPVDLPTSWSDVLNKPESAAEAESIRICIQRGHPYGDAHWRREAAAKLGLSPELRGPGRPRKDGA